ncbi:oocyte zinc finger protein XlCOF29-like [Ranitomeya imitator]|uniref:oocyte zinc finger protein XlCOF29-like n=1 Tax=Ranitomeya imitator TaxID=111125 RepID=UPI0037E8E00C
MDKNHISEKILKLTLEIIYLLTGEDYSVVNKAGKHVSTIRGNPCQPEGLCKMVRPDMDSPPEVYEKNNEQKILDLTNKIIALLTGEVPMRCEDIIVCFSMEEWEYIEGHKDLYKDVIMENHPFLGSSDFPSSDNLSMKLNLHVQSPDVACEDHSLTLCKPKAKIGVFEDKQKVTLQSDHDKFTSLSTCTKYTQTEAADSEEGVLSEDTEVDVIYVPPQNTQLGSSSDAYTAYKGGNPKDSDICLLSEQIQNTPDGNRSVVEPCEDGILAVDNIYTPACVKSMDLTDQSTQWGNDVNLGHSTMSPHHTNPQYMSGCIIEVHSDCEEGIVTGTDVYTPTVHKSALYTSDKVKEIPISWGKDVIYTNVYTPVELTQADLSSIKKELVSWKDGSLELQNIYIPSKPMGEKAESTSYRVDTLQWNGSHANPHSSPSLHKVSPHIKTEEHFPDYYETAGQTQPSHTPVNPEDYNDDAIKKEMLNMSIDYESDHGRPEYTTSQMYSCSDCKKCFSSDTNLVKHRLMCRGRKPHVCSECGKCFASASYLVIHERIHTGEKPYSCSHCGKSFSRKPDLIRHERIHTGEKPFACPECGKCFTSVSNIFMHRRIHTGEKPFPCGECGKRFIKKSDLVRHQKIHSR